MSALGATPGPPDGPQEPGPQNALEQLLVHAAEHPGDREAGPAFVAAFMDASVGVPGTVQDGGFVPLVTELSERRRAGLAFTHPSRGAWWGRQWTQTQGEMPPGFEVRGTTGRDLMRQLVGHNLGLVLNPANRHGKEFLVAEMSDLLAGVDPGTTHRVAQQGSSVEVGEPAYVPEGLVERLRDGFVALGGVATASLGWIRYEDGLQGYLLGVTTSRPRDEVLPVVERCVEVLEGRTLDVTVGPPGATLLTAHVPPFLTA
ncbi:hypothetical protein ASG49_15040 [Marmoricola sp. Leaf446]|uniref:enhanced serine sensitivity protein SseB C-terminal domain-containing protein n=1 Tax=Marmoricola sp. Leaf446 TaxID=1736379 RepID=UPI0006F81587|nr:enhanced serine sensitivity protein SseB C-terminal domain-containing protein [Marmoricola sp. Leaf446]KQT89130.1 hypothetical protein ASG49_15040 [Marmoricola sp. Leaf446]